MPKQALIMIDMQRGFLDSASPLCIPSAEATVPACAALIDRCHAAGVPVIYAVRHYRSDGSDVEKPRAAAWAAGGKPLSEDCAAHLSDAFPSAFTVLPQDYVLVKPRFSAFFHTGLDLILRRLGVQTVLLAGTTTPNCIRTTCYDAISASTRSACRTKSACRWGYVSLPCAHHSMNFRISRISSPERLRHSITRSASSSCSPKRRAPDVRVRFGNSPSLS